MTRRRKLIAPLVVLGSLGGVAVWQLTSGGHPSFRRGGEFATGALTDDPGSPAETTATSGPSGEDASTNTTTEAAVPGTTAGLVGSTATTTGARAEGGGGATTTTRVPGTPSSTPSAGGTTPTTSAALPPTTTSALPALGTYTYAVDGTEAVTFFGSRRLPNRMTTVVHGAEGLSPDQLVFDLRYSGDHAEREIVSFSTDGIAFHFEGGSITFGPRTETSQADYDPPMLQIPFPLAEGATRSGTSAAKAADGSVQRTEDWTTKVLGREPVTVAGTPIDTWKVKIERKSRPGTADQTTRERTYWYDPGRKLWVRFVDVIHGERKSGGVTFTYDSNIDATLLSFAPA